MLIYKLTNTINNKVYIGQTNDFNKRMNGHKSNSTNKKSHSYSLPLYTAIRKYGWDNFTKEVLEENNELNSKEEQVAWANEREKYYISIYNSTNKKKGYNISLGGEQSPKQQLTFEEKVALSKKFNLEEVKEIQSLLLKETSKKLILEKFFPRLTESLLDNINQGLNFKDNSLQYPLFDYLHSEYSIRFTNEQQREIQLEIKSGKHYKDISRDWGISTGLISLINNGSIWNFKEFNYPLCVKGSSRSHNWHTWAQPMIQDLMTSNLTLKQIADKYDKSYSTVKKINEGISYRDKNKIYPLIKNR